MKITRQFSKRIQLRQFEPIEVSCKIEEECASEEMETVSSKLSDLCLSEVQKTLQKIRPALKEEQGMSKAEKHDKGLDFAG
jgi:hypothetical protein